VTTSRNSRSRARWWVLPVLLLATFLVTAYYWSQRRDAELAATERLFDRFFSGKPFPAEVVEYGFDQTFLGDGSYVIVFRMSEEDLRRFLENQGFEATGIETEPGHWRLDLVNSIIGSVIKMKVQIDPVFECYAKKTDRTSGRVYYDKARSLAVFVGRGRYPR